MHLFARYFIYAPTILFADDAKVASLCSQSGSLKSYFTNVWKWSIDWDIPIDPTKYNFIAIGQATPV